MQRERRRINRPGWHRASLWTATFSDQDPRHSLTKINRYRTVVHACFPILRREDLEDAADSHGLRPALVSTIIALTAFFWGISNELRATVKPDLQYTWNIAIDALNDDFQAPTIATILTALLDLTGRPSVNTLGNEGTMGHVIAAAYSMGLNREPRPSTT